MHPFDFAVHAAATLLGAATEGLGAAAHHLLLSPCAHGGCAAVLIPCDPAC